MRRSVDTICERCSTRRGFSAAQTLAGRAGFRAIVSGAGQLALRRLRHPDAPQGRSGDSCGGNFITRPRQDIGKKNG